MLLVDHLGPSPPMQRATREAVPCPFAATIFARRLETDRGRIDLSAQLAEGATSLECVPGPSDEFMGRNDCHGFESNNADNVQNPS